MTLFEELRKAVAQGDYLGAQTLLPRLPQAPATLEEIGEIRDLLAWALQMARINRAHESARLAELIRSSAYRPRNTERRSTWTLDA